MWDFLIFCMLRVVIGTNFDLFPYDQRQTGSNSWIKLTLLKCRWPGAPLFLLSDLAFHFYILVVTWSLFNDYINRSRYRCEKRHTQLSSWCIEQMKVLCGEKQLTRAVELRIYQRISIKSVTTSFKSTALCSHWLT